MTGKERAQLRAQANSLEPVFQIGKGGVSDALIKQTADALKARELIKIKALLETVHETPRELADKLSAATGAEVIQVIGGSIVLYKENPELRAAEKEKVKRKKEAAKKAKLKARMTETKRYPRFTPKASDERDSHKFSSSKKSQPGDGKTEYKKKTYSGTGNTAYKSKPQSGERKSDRRQQPSPAGSGTTYKGANKPASRSGVSHGQRPTSIKGNRPKTSQNSPKGTK